VVYRFIFASIYQSATGTGNVLGGFCHGKPGKIMELKKWLFPVLEKPLIKKI